MLTSWVLFVEKECEYYCRQVEQEVGQNLLSNKRLPDSLIRYRTSDTNICGLPFGLSVLDLTIVGVPLWALLLPQAMPPG